MRKFILAITLSLTALAVSGMATRTSPPECDPNCPFVR